MPYSLKPGHAVSRDVRATISRQLALTADHLNVIGIHRRHHTIREARRHIKKIIAVLRLMRTTLGPAYVVALRRMKTARHMLGPIADAEAPLDAVAVLIDGTPRVARATVDAVRKGLLDREARIDRKATLDDVLHRVSTLVAAQQADVGRWRFRMHGFDALAPGLERTVRRARSAMAYATAHPTDKAYHAWRRRVKDLWLQVRFIDRRCGDGFRRERRELEALDALLGSYHNVTLLEEILVAEPRLSRDRTIACLRVLKTRRAKMRRRALARGRRLLNERPRAFVRRAARLWKSAHRQMGSPVPRAGSPTWQPAST